MSSSRQRKEPWRNNERHYCAVCNAWMGSDRQSIMIHENGKKHQENVEKAMQQKRQEKKKEEQSQKMLLDSLQKMEQAAVQAHLRNDGNISSSLITPSAVPSLPVPNPAVSYAATPKHEIPPPPPPPPLQKSSKEEKKQWQERKRQREAQKQKASDDQAEDVDQEAAKKRKISPDGGHYEYDGKTFLEGPVFYELLEEDMPCQIWTGPLTASLHEKRLPERDMYWKTALIVAVRPEKVHVSYLASTEDADETLEKNVPLDRIRIILGSDDAIPDTLEEARLLAMGGEEIQVEPKEAARMDEATGLSGWSTVAIKRTTVRQEVKEERARLREKRKQDAAEMESKEKEAEARKLEELKVANADDSALGSVYFAELGREVKGYKGVDIANTGDEKLTVADTTAKSLAAGKGPVGFKNTKKKPMNNRSRRTTSADDD